MNRYKDFRDMSVWQKAFSLLRDVYKIIKVFPPEEKYALTEDLIIRYKEVADEFRALIYVHWKNKNA